MVPPPKPSGIVPRSRPPPPTPPASTSSQHPAITDLLEFRAHQVVVCQNLNREQAKIYDLGNIIRAAINWFHTYENQGLTFWTWKGYERYPSELFEASPGVMQVWQDSRTFPPMYGGRNIAVFDGEVDAFDSAWMAEDTEVWGGGY